jgi:hypothetical protein
MICCWRDGWWLMSEGVGRSGGAVVQQAGGWWAIALVLVMAVALRVAFWSLQAQSGAVQPADPEEYYRAAVQLLHGGYDDTGKWLRPPLYPAFLAVMFFLGGINVALALLGQALFSALSVLTFVLMGGWLFERPNVALLSGVIAALFVPLASFGSVLFAEALFVPLIILALALLDRVLVTGNRWMALLGGIVLGLAALTRAVALFFIPVSMLLILFFSRRNNPQPARNWLARRGVRPAWSTLLPALLLGMGAVLTIGPWTARNYAVHERLILVDTNGAISMWYGMVQGEADQQQGEARLAAVENPADRQALAMRMTVERITADPLLFVTRMRYKVASLFTLQLRNFATGELVTISPQDDHVVTGAGENPLRVTLIADAQYVLVMLLGIIGLSFAPSWRRALPTLLWLAFGVLISAITVAHPRLRLPLVCALIPFSAYALLQLPRALRRPGRYLRDYRTLPALFGCLLFLGLIFSWNYVAWIKGERYAVPARWAAARDNPARAERLFEQARETDPGNALRLIDLADLALMQGDTAEAATFYRQATELEQRNLYAHAMRIQTAALRDDPEEAQSALAAIDSYGRDNNDLYAWAWNNVRTPAPARIVPGEPSALGHYTGFAPATFDLAQGRWTLGHGRLRLSGDCGTLTLRLHGPAGREVRIRVADSAIRERVVLTGEPQEVVLSLADQPDCAANQPVVVHIQSKTGLLDLERAPWSVGVAVLEAAIGRNP